MSAANAKLNWQTENPGWNFNAVKSAAQKQWNKLLGRIQVSGGTAAKTQQFYSLLYKDFLQPNISSDVNGQYMGSDNKVHTRRVGAAEPVRDLLRLGHVSTRWPSCRRSSIPSAGRRPGSVAAQLLLRRTGSCSSGDTCSSTTT